MKFSKSLLLILGTFLLAINCHSQVEEILLSDISKSWDSGEYQLYVVYEENGGMIMRGGKVELEIEKDDEGLISRISYKIQNVTHEYAPRNYGGTSSGAFIGFKGRRNDYLYATKTSLAHYSMRSGKVDELKYMIGEKIGGTKKTKKIIQTYFDGLEEITNNREAARKAELAAHREKYSIKDKDLKEIKLELVSEQSKIDCGAKFQIHYTAILGDGTQIKSKSQGGEAYSSEFKIKVLGADKESLKTKDGNKMGYSEYTVHKYCDNMDDKHLLVEVSSRYHPEITGKVRLATSCVPDPEIIAQKKREEEREKERQLMAEQAKEKEKERQRLLAEQEKKAAERAKALASKVGNGEVVGNGNGVGLVFFQSNTRLISKQHAKYSINSLKDLNGKKVGFGKNLTTNNIAIVRFENGNVNVQDVMDGGYSTDGMKDGDLDNQGNLYYANSSEVVYAKKSGSAFKVEKSAKLKDLYPDAEIYPSAITYIGDNKCLILAYSTVDLKDSPSEYSEYRKGDPNNVRRRPNSSYMIVWDRVTGKAWTRVLKDKYARNYPKSMRTHDNKQIIVTGERYNSDIYKIDALASFQKQELVTVWKKNISHDVTDIAGKVGYQAVYMTEDKDKNILITWKDIYQHIAWEYEPGDYRNEYYTPHGLGRIDKNGALYQESMFHGFNLSSWGASDKFSLEARRYPGQILLHRNGFPFVMQHPVSGDYLFVTHGTKDQVIFPDNFNKSAKYVGTNSPLVAYLSSVNLALNSFGIIEVNQAEAGTNTSTSYKYDGPYFGVYCAEYNKSTNYISLYPIQELSLITAKPVLRTQWGAAAPQDVTPKKGNKANDLPDYSTTAGSNSSSFSNKSSSSSSSSNSSSSSSGPKMVRMKVNPNNVGQSTVKVYWKVDGSWKKQTMNSRTTTNLGEIAAGTDLYYTVDNESESKKRKFYTVPENRSNSETATIK